jgi:hypothetical protein
MWDMLGPDTTLYVLEAIARAALEAAAVLVYLLEPQISARRRVIRSWLIRASGARYLDMSVKSIDPKSPAGVYGETPAMVLATMASLGLVL